MHLTCVVERSACARRSVLKMSEPALYCQWSLTHLSATRKGTNSSPKIKNLKKRQGLPNA